MAKKHTPNFHPGGHKGKLHRELGIPEGEKIGKARLARAAHSGNPEIARDAKRAQTMSHWHHGGTHPHHGRGSGHGRVGHR